MMQFYTGGRAAQRLHFSGVTRFDVGKAIIACRSAVLLSNNRKRATINELCKLTASAMRTKVAFMLHMIEQLLTAYGVQRCVITASSLKSIPCLSCLIYALQAVFAGKRFIW